MTPNGCVSHLSVCEKFAPSFFQLCVPTHMRFEQRTNEDVLCKSARRFENSQGKCSSVSLSSVHAFIQPISST